MTRFTNRYWLPLILMLASWPTWATNNEHDCRGNQPCGNADAEANAASSSSSDSRSDATATAGSASDATATSGGNTFESNVTFNEPSDITLRNVASPDTPNPYPTAPCRVGVSAGLSLAGGALSGGGSIEDTECTLRETARSFKDLGVPEMGLYLLCTQSEVIIGRTDKKGEPEKGAPPAVGTAECLRLVREFTAPVDGDNTGGSVAPAVQKELAVLQGELERYADTQQRIADELAAVSERSKARPAAVVRPETRIVQQEYLDDAKKNRLAQLQAEKVVSLDDEETD